MLMIESYQALTDPAFRSLATNNALLSGKLDEYLEKGRIKTIHIPDKYPNTRYKSWFTPSELGSATGKSLCGKYSMGCALRMYHKIIGTKKVRKIPATLRKRFDAGSALHAMFQSYFLDMSDKGYLQKAAAEVEIVPEMGGLAEKYRFISKIDLDYTIDNFNYIGEIKTIAQNQFTGLAKPKQEHITQLNTCMALKDIPVGNLLYASFSPEVPIKEFIIEFDATLWKACINKMDYVLDCAKNKKPPKKEGNYYMCKSCPYEHACADKTLRVDHGI